MDDHRRRETPFSFPVVAPPPTLDSDDQFEFGSVTAPASPNSPADRFFSNGKLLPHVFPVQQPHGGFSYSRSTSRASSAGSKDSLMSSRSNSTSSNCSSARTSTSESVASERRLSAAIGGVRTPVRRDRSRNRPVLGSQYYSHGSSQRWQLMAAAPAVSSHQGSRSRKVEKPLTKSRGINGQERKQSIGRRILKSFVSACKECHAIKSTTAMDGALPRTLEV